MPASPLVTRRRLLIAAVVLALAVGAVVAVMTLRPDAAPAAGATTSATPTASSDEGAEVGSGETDPGEGDPADPTPSDGDRSDGDPADAEPGGDVDPAAPEARETLDPAPFDATATPEPGVTVTVPSVEEVTGEANVPGEVGGPALRFGVELTNGTGKTLDLRTVVVNAYYGPDRTPATPLLKPGGRAFVPEVADGDSVSGTFVFSVPADQQDKVELEIDPGVGSAIVIFTGS